MFVVADFFIALLMTSVLWGAGMADVKLALALLYVSEDKTLVFAVERHRYISSHLEGTARDTCGPFAYLPKWIHWT